MPTYAPGDRVKRDFRYTKLGYKRGLAGWVYGTVTEAEPYVYDTGLVSTRQRLTVQWDRAKQATSIISDEVVPVSIGH